MYCFGPTLARFPPTPVLRSHLTGKRPAAASTKGEAPSRRLVTTVGEVSASPASGATGLTYLGAADLVPSVGSHPAPGPGRG